jgi:hypothetical protein
MTTYTLTKELHKFICGVLYGYCFGDEIKAYELLRSLKPNSQEPVGYQCQTTEGDWSGFLNEEHLAAARADGRWPIRAIYDHPAPMSKEDMVKVLDVLTWATKNCEDAWISDRADAITIMQSAIEATK